MIEGYPGLELMVSQGLAAHFFELKGSDGIHQRSLDAFDMEVILSWIKGWDGGWGAGRQRCAEHLLLGVHLPQHQSRFSFDRAMLYFEEVLTKVHMLYRHLIINSNKTALVKIVLPFPISRNSCCSVCCPSRLFYVYKSYVHII